MAAIYRHFLFMHTVNLQKTRARKPHSKWWYWFQYTIVVGILFATLGISIVLVWALTLQIPDFTLLDKRERAQSTKIYDRTSEHVLFDVYGDVQRTLIPLDQININVQNATIAIEDAEFYQHSGIKPTAIFRSVIVNFTHGEYAQGGSTLTQQVVKNGLLTREKTITRKVKEWILALKLERAKTKKEILELYLNDAPYGGTLVGVEEASKGYFHKPAKELGIAESAYLAALPQSPTRLRPFGPNKAALDARKNLVLSRMNELGMISKEEAEKAKKEKVEFFVPQTQLGEKGAEHFIMDVKEQLEEEYGAEYVKSAGFRVITSLDMNMQKMAEETIREHRDRLKDDFNSDTSALVAVDPKTGDVLALVGSADFYDKEIDGMFDVITKGKRQPGSSFKPFVYAQGFAKGYEPSTVLFDARTVFVPSCSPDLSSYISNEDKKECYRPRNYDDMYRGPVSLRSGLAQSLNVPAVKMLWLLGVKDTLNFVRNDMGLTVQTDGDPGLSMVLGSLEMTPLEIAHGYTAFANDGVTHKPRMILRIEDEQGKVIKDYESESKKVFDPDVARKISDVLSDNSARAPSYGWDSPLNFLGRQVAAKTGTTNNSKDFWVVGYTPSVVLVTWAGNHDNTPMTKKTAGFALAPMWRAYLDKVFKQYPDLYPQTDTFGSPSPVDMSKKGILRGAWLSPEGIHDILHFINRGNPLGSGNGISDPQYPGWEFAAQKWIRENGLPGEAVAGAINQAAASNITSPQVSFLDATSTTRLLDEKYIVRVGVTGQQAIDRVDFFFDGQFLGSAHNNPYEFAFLPNMYTNVPGQHTIRVQATDRTGGIGEISVQEQFTTVTSTDSLQPTKPQLETETPQ